MHEVNTINRRLTDHVRMLLQRMGTFKIDLIFFYKM